MILGILISSRVKGIIYSILLTAWEKDNFAVDLLDRDLKNLWELMGQYFLMIVDLLIMKSDPFLEVTAQYRCFLIYYIFWGSKLSLIEELRNKNTPANTFEM